MSEHFKNFFEKNQKDSKKQHSLFTDSYMMFENFYVFVGLDGSGKSSTIDELLKYTPTHEAFTLSKIVM